MLNGKLCSIYENRPDVCRSFPHLEQPEFTSQLMGVIDNVAVCPIAFNAFEELKAKLAWRRPYCGGIHDAPRNKYDLVMRSREEGSGYWCAAP